MIRANLLPRPKQTFGAFGVEFDANYVRQACLGIAIVLAVALLGTVVERLRVARLESNVATLEAALASRAAMRAESQRLALEVARYQQFARRAQLSRRSGPAAAIAVARLGNGVPNRVWLDSLSHSATGYDLSGGADDMDVVSGAIATFGHALPSVAATLVSVENHPGDGIRFAARVSPSR